MTTQQSDEARLTPSDQSVVELDESKINQRVIEVIDAMADAIEQRHPNLVLELLDRLTDRRLCRGHGFGGPREAALPHDLDENAQRPKLHANSIAE